MGGSTEAYRWATSLQHAETNYGVQILDANLTKWLEINEARFAKVDKKYRTNRNRIKGARGATNYQVVSAEGMLSRTFDLSVEIFTWALALQLGLVTSSGSVDPWTQVLKHPSVCTQFPKSTSFIEEIACPGMTGTKFLYKGACVDQQVITMNGQDAVQHTINMKMDGSETAKAAFVSPTSTEALNYVLGSHQTVKLNPIGGDISITSQVQQLKITLNSALQRRKEANNSIYAPGYKFSKGNPSMAVELVVSGDKSDTIYGYYKNDTKLRLQTLWDCGVVPLRSINMDVPECYIESCEADSDDIEPTLSIKFDLLDVIANNGPAIWTNKVGQATYLVNGS